MKLANTWRTGKILCPSIELSLTLTLLGGQSFRWKQINDETLGKRFQGVFQNHVWTLWSDPSYLHYEVNDLDAASAERALREYFRLDEALPDLYAEWSSRDAFFKQTCREFVGIRMLNQDLVENLFSFLCSSNNNIARISSMIDKMCTEYGAPICTLDQNQRGEIKSEIIPNEFIKSEDVKEFHDVIKNEPMPLYETDTRASRKRTRNSMKTVEIPKSQGDVPTSRGSKNARIDYTSQGTKKSRTKSISVIQNEQSEVKDRNGCSGNQFFAFPTVEALAQPAVEAKLRELGFGYRAKFIQKSAEYIVEHGGEEWLQRVRGMNYEEAREELQKLQGIGAKVADCICLMSLSHLQSVPVDTHVYQIAVNHYAFPKLPTKTLTAAAYNQIRSFFIEKFGNYAGWAHSILFCADLKKFQTPSLTAQSDKGRKNKGTR